MDPARQRQLTDFVSEQLTTTPRTIRGLSVLGLIVCIAGLALLIAVWFDGGEGAADAGVPAVLFAGLTVLGFMGFGWSHWRVRSRHVHPLVVALAATPPTVAAAASASINNWPALRLELRDRSQYYIQMDELTRAEMMAWLSQEGAHVG